MMKQYFLLVIFVFSSITAIISLSLQAQEQTYQKEEISNPLIDSKGFLDDIDQSHKLRIARRVTEDEFIKMSEDKNTIILDARTPERFKQMHIKGSKHLSFTEFTEDNLRNVIPDKNTRILIYCNNNIANSPEAFATKSFRAALNLSTYTSLYSYGYKNVYELGPMIDTRFSKIKFEGALTNVR
jgi:Rhodanese-like domain